MDCGYFIPHKTAITLVFWHQHWLVGGAAPSLSNRRSKWPTLFEKRRLRPLSAYNVSTVRDSEKVQSRGIQSRPRAFQWAIDGVRTLPLNPERVAQKAIFVNPWASDSYSRRLPALSWICYVDIQSTGRTLSRPWSRQPNDVMSAQLHSWTLHSTRQSHGLFALAKHLLTAIEAINLLTHSLTDDDDVGSEACNGEDAEWSSSSNGHRRGMSATERKANWHWPGPWWSREMLVKGTCLLATTRILMCYQRHCQCVRCWHCEQNLTVKILADMHHPQHRQHNAA